MKLVSAVIVVILFFNLPAFSQHKIKISTIKLENQIDSLILPIVKDSLISGTILIAINDNILFHKAYGMANIENGIPNTVETKYPLASVTKMFTAVSILQLYEKGKLDLQDKLNKYIPDFPNGERITIFNLLTHSSGIPSYSTVDQENTNFNNLISKIKELPLKFEPGMDAEYSNSGYALLTYIVEKISGYKYEDFIYENILKPCKMDQSGILLDDSSWLINNLANGYTFDESGKIQKAKIVIQHGKGEGALYSSTCDLYKFNKALFNKTLISFKTLDLMMKPFNPEKDLEHFGLGCFIEDHNGWKVVSHDGGVVGIRTLLKVYIKPDTKVMIINLFNTDFMLSNLVDQQIERIALSEPWKPIFYQDQKLIKGFQKFVGTYEISPDDTFKITIENGQLFYQENNQKKCSTFLFYETALFIKELNARIHFSEDKKTGKVSFTGYFGTPISAYMVTGTRIKE